MNALPDMTASATSDPVEVASRLCAACGMCCNGVMFFSMRLQPEDSARKLAALGLRAKSRSDGQHIPQPCSAHDGRQCTIYSERPQRCRAFECQQLRKVAKGILTESAAMAKIFDARTRVARVEELFHSTGDHRKNKAFATRFAAAFAPPLDSNPAAIQVRDDLRIAMAELEELLAQDFRVEPDSD